MAKAKKTTINEATINDYGPDGYTAIGRACNTNDSKTVKYLLKTFPGINTEKGKQSPFKEEWSLSALDIAKTSKNAKLIKILALHNPLALPHSEGNIPTMKGNGFTEILMNQGIDSFLSEITGIGPAYAKGVSRALRSSIKDHKEEETISSLAQSVSVARDDTPEKHELYTAIRADNIVAIKSIHAIMPELINTSNAQHHQTALHYAARQAKNEILEFLITESNNLSPLDIKGYSPLDYALKEGHISTAALLITHGLINSKFKNKYDKACKTSDYETIKKLEKYIDTLKQAQEIVDEHAAESDFTESAAVENSAYPNLLDDLTQAEVLAENATNVAGANTDDIGI